MSFPSLDFLDSLARVFQITLAEALGADAPEPGRTKEERDVFSLMADLLPPTAG